MLSISEQKTIMRRQAIQKRRLHAEYNQNYNTQLNSNIFNFICDIYKKNTVIGCFWPLQDEPDLRPVIQRLHYEQYVVALPETTPKGNPLSFHIWTPDVILQTGLYQTQHPQSDYIVPEILLVPLLAFDCHGNRLGYGGGYYDRTFADLPTVHKIGVAFAYQKVETVPVAEFDCPLSAIITDDGISRIK